MLFGVTSNSALGEALQVSFFYCMFENFIIIIWICYMNIFIQLIENVLVMKTLPKIIFSIVGVCSYCNIFRSCGWYVIIGKQNNRLMITYVHDYIAPCGTSVPCQLRPVVRRHGRGVLWTGGDPCMTGCLECPLASPVFAQSWSQTAILTEYGTRLRHSRAAVTDHGVCVF